MSRVRFRARYSLAPLVLPCGAQAHSFGKLYNLPVPFWLYIWGATSALLLSFLLVAWFLTRDSASPELRVRELGEAAWLRRLRAPQLLKGLSLCALLLCLATGFFGTRNAYLNFNMTFFWIVFVLGFTYFTALCGGLYERLNPWKLLVQGLGRFAAGAFRGRVAYPPALGCWPALGFYMAFIWLELFGKVQPYSLALALSIYSAINLAGAWLFGASAWFRYCEFFAVFLRLVATMAPLEYRPAAAAGAHGTWQLRAPFVGLLRQRAESQGEVLFLLFMLSSTTFDGLRETAPWKQLFWVDLHQALRPWLSGNIVADYPLLRQLNLACETLCLLLSPFLYYAAYLACIALARRLTRSALSLHELALHFAYPLLPIALVYNITHYYTLIITQGTQILRLLSDPFGAGWNLFGTARWLPSPILPDMGLVWHTQVGLILLGHVLSVYLAHLAALRLFPSRREATLSQLPMLLLMMAFTTIGLWILAQPITSASAGG
ncbi:MAG TPA: hypothetical protein VNX47_07330 [Nevskia sp.]|nr:hypothetical protein [Nevskia sp.]